MPRLVALAPLKTVYSNAVSTPVRIQITFVIWQKATTIAQTVLHRWL